MGVFIVFSKFRCIGMLTSLNCDFSRVMVSLLLFCFTFLCSFLSNMFAEEIEMGGIFWISSGIGHLKCQTYNGQCENS